MLSIVRIAPLAYENVVRFSPTATYTVCGDGHGSAARAARRAKPRSARSSLGFRFAFIGRSGRIEATAACTVCGDRSRLRCARHEAREASKPAKVNWVSFRVLRPRGSNRSDSDIPDLRRRSRLRCARHEAREPSKPAKLTWVSFRVHRPLGSNRSDSDMQRFAADSHGCAARVTKLAKPRSPRSSLGFRFVFIGRSGRIEATATSTICGDSQVDDSGRDPTENASLSRLRCARREAREAAKPAKPAKLDWVAFGVYCSLVVG